MAYGSVGAAFGGTGVEDAMMARKKQQVEDLMTQLAVQKAQSDLLTAEQARDTSKKASEWQAEDAKLRQEDQKQKIHAAKVLDWRSRAPFMKGAPAAPEWVKEGASLGQDVSQYVKPGQAAKPLSFGAPSPLPTQQPMAPPAAPVTMGAPEGLGTEVTPPEVIPAQEATPDTFLGNQQQQMQGQAAELIKGAKTREEAAVALLQAGFPYNEIDSFVNAMAGPRESTSGALGEFRARAQMPPEEQAAFDAYQTTDANRKRPVVNVSNAPNEQGFTPKQTATFLSLMSAVDRSPLIRAGDRTPVMEAAVSAIERDPGNASYQLNLAYSYIQALDTYMSAVREGELQLAQGLGTRMQQLGLEADRVYSKGGVMPEAVAKQMASSAKEMVATINAARDKKLKDFKARANTANVGPMWDDWEAQVNGGASAPGGASAASAPAKRVRYDMKGNVIKD